MKLYINATGNISPQHTCGHPALLADPAVYNSVRLHCAEPDYKQLIDVKLIRRMSRIVRMGVAAATECLQEAGIGKPDAIVTGTAYGCLEDTGHFITKMVEQNEELLTPTAFIQSTHNTIGAQIGLLLQCNNYNNAFVHRGFSFESALQDARMLLQEKEAENVLVGAVDEITDISHTLLTRFGLYRREAVENFRLFDAPAKGTIAGEGAAFFLLSSGRTDKSYASIDGLQTLYKPSGPDAVEAKIKSFLADNNTSLEDISLVITGKNGDVQNDRLYEFLQEGLLKDKALAVYKHLCGEYPTAAAFAAWLAAWILKTQTVPPALRVSQPVTAPVNKILLVTSYQQTHHSLVLLSAC
ncbi:MAG: beta-ketoacyl synthase chain length factor [Ferruginibacter sp.]